MEVILETYFLYNFILVNCAIFSFIAEKIKNINLELLSRIVVFLTLTIPASLRYYTGTDYGSYVRMFSDDSYLESKEILWVWLNRFVQFLNLDVQWVFVFSAILIYFPLCFKIKKKFYFISIILYIVLSFYFKSYNVVRQMITVSFILWAFICYGDRKFMQMILLYIISIGFHSSAIILFPLFICSFVNLSFKIKFLPLILFTLLMFIVLNINLVEPMFKAFDFLNLKYLSYKNSTMYLSERHSGSGFLGVFIRTGFIFLSIISYTNIVKKFPSKLNVLNLSIMYLIAYILCEKITIFDRIRDLLSFSVILIAGIIFYCSGQYKKIIFIFFIILNIIVFEITIKNQNRQTYSNQIYPYYSIFYKGEIK